MLSILHKFNEVAKMLKIKGITHVGIRVSNIKNSVNFYEKLGFEYMTDVGFAQGHPVIMKHPCGLMINLLGPAII